VPFPDIDFRFQLADAFIGRSELGQFGAVESGHLTGVDELLAATAVDGLVADTRPAAIWATGRPAGQEVEHFARELVGTTLGPWTPLAQGSEQSRQTGSVQPRANQDVNQTRAVLSATALSIERPFCDGRRAKVPRSLEAGAIAVCRSACVRTMNGTRLSAVVDNPKDASDSAPPVEPKFDLQGRWVGEVMVLAVRGELDALTAPMLAQAISSGLIDASTALIVDLSELDFLASTGMAVLLEGHQAAGSSKRFGVVADGAATSRPLKMLGLDSELNLFPTLNAAIKGTR
jgi:anti-sigma B factor antagonist